MTNDEMDKEILGLLLGKPLKFCSINAVLNRNYNYKTYRQIDRRLQALRKNGKVSFSHGFGWSLK